MLRYPNAANIQSDCLRDGHGTLALCARCLRIGHDGSDVLKLVAHCAGGSISITCCNHRAFGQEQWRELRDRLGAWAVGFPIHSNCTQSS